ncbi:tetratricopeptide repeat protein [Microbacteriaceae bacterium VKM Ac-2854]|nr:tetratricopeptide repeat protein [Microbacteriaceae bacterium VKM Ac-2854]
MLEFSDEFTAANPELELTDEVHEAIKEFCAEGDAHADAGEYTAAEQTYLKAWDLLPDPKEQWNAATWILVAIGDSLFLSGSFTRGVEVLTHAMHCPGAIGDPFIHLRLGQCQFEVGNLTRAADELARGFLQEGDELFEEDDPKYLAFVKSRLRPPHGGW